MSRRSYNQYCSAAKALDVIGDRWLLLLVRELLLGPRRFTDLQDGLPGIGPNRLTEKLKQLQANGLVRRATLPPPAGSAVYELTENGCALEPVVVELARWGLGLLGDPADDRWRPEWSVLALRARFQPEAARGVNEAYQFRVNDVDFYALVQDGRHETALGAAENPAVTITADATTFLAVASGGLLIEQAIESGGYRIAGDTEALARCMAIYKPPSTGSV